MKPGITIFLFWTLVNTILLLKNGIVSTGEAEKYIGEAHLFLQTGQLSTSNHWLYFTQIALLAFSIRFKTGFILAITIQLFFNLAATYGFYRALKYIFRHEALALAGTILLIINYPYQEFNTFLQTESLFYSLSLLYSCYLIQIERLSLKNLTGIILLIMLLSITRPVGLLFLPPTFIYLFFIFFRKMKPVKKLTLFAIIGFIFLFILNSAMGSGGGFDFMLPFRDENIICGLPSPLRNLHAIKTASDGNSLYGLLYYIVNNTSRFARLAWMRTLVFFGLYRSYYTKIHNLYLIIYFYSLHLFILFGISYWLKTHLYKMIYFTSVILITLLTVMLTCDDWHNRFYLGISPYIIILSLGIFPKRLKKEERLPDLR